MSGRMLGGRYELGASLGAGGMATVWQATDLLLGRQVAVKVLREQYALDPSFLARFQREARHAASVSDPRIVTVFDCGVDAGAPFIVMELVSGRTLRQVLDQARVLSAGEAVSVAAEMCAALEVAHAAGLVHRDIKPANVLVTSGGQIKILDFGIARMAQSAGLTQTGTLIGTAEYLSPEQGAGQPAGPQADLYAVGCVLYEMLTGTPPFTADSPAALVYRHVHDQPAPPSARRPGLPPQLDGLVLRLLAKDPAARPGSAAAARAALLAAVSAGPAAAVASQATAPGGQGLTRTLPVTAPPPRRTWPRALIPVAAAVLGAAAALLAVTLTSHPAPAVADPSTPAPSAAAHHTVAAKPKASPAPHHTAAASPSTPAVPTMAAAAGDLVRDLEAGVQDGQVTPQAGQNMFGHLQPLLFNPGGQQPQQAAQQDQQQYQQIVQAFDQGTSQGQITGSTTITTLQNDLNELDRTLPSAAA